jgi:hypothetical protein
MSIQELVNSYAAYQKELRRIETCCAWDCEQQKIRIGRQFHKGQRAPRP